jgi:predicted RNA-binding Zn ribbon-like protein
VGDWEVALALVSTIRHDGEGGAVDDLATVDGLGTWLAGLSEVELAVGVQPDEKLRVRVTALRRAVRSLFARAVRPNPPSKADAGTLLDTGVALAELNRAARVLGSPTLHWPDDAAPGLRYPMAAATPPDRLLGQLAQATIGFLTGDDVTRLRACPAPRCVRYFLQADPRQAWCKPSCGNRARVARHYQRHHSP